MQYGPGSGWFPVLALPDCVGQVGHPLRRLCADRLKGHAARVDAFEQADSGAEQHGCKSDRELVDQPGVHVLQDRCATACDAHISVAGSLAGPVERGLDPVVDEVEDGPTRPLPGVTFLVCDDEGRCVEISEYVKSEGAAGVGFEPTDELPRQRFSRPPDSTALAPRRAS